LLYVIFTIDRRGSIADLHDYFEYSSRLVSTRKLVEIGYHAISN
jgi:hypothetical protein